MRLLYLLEGLRSPVGDSFFSMITYLGSEIAFMVIGVFVFWCVSKKDGYYLMTVGFFGTLLSQAMKLICRVPRPWVSDPKFSIVESARADATGYSFPSGHSQSAAGSLGGIARFTKRRYCRVICAVLIILTCFSRMYLGVHTPADVAAGLIIGLGCAFLVRYFFVKYGDQPNFMYALILTVVGASLVYVLCAELLPIPADIDAVNLAEGRKNGYTMLGCGLGMLLAYRVDRRTDFKVEAPWWAQILKTVIGLLLLFAIKTGLKPVMNAVFAFNTAMGSAVRYFIVVFFAVAVWPLTFPWFAKGCPMSARGKRALRVVLIIILVIVLLGAYLFWEITRDTMTEPVATDGAENALITPLGTSMLCGHRAGGGTSPENTMMALKSCVECESCQPDILEFDLHLTADGVLVLLHDETLDRTSDACEVFGGESILVGTKTLEELKALNMGEKFEAEDGSTPYAGLRGGDVPDELRILSLGEALEYIEANGRYNYIIEIKNSGEQGYEAADRLHELLIKYDCIGRTVVGTFNGEVTEYLDENYPDIIRSAGVSECLDFYICSLLNRRVDDGRFGFEVLQIPTTDYVVNMGTSRVINYAHSHDIAVQYWTINDPGEAARLQSIGADAIMTDYLETAAAVLNRP